MTRASACTGGRTPVTLEQAVKAPIFSGRSRYRSRISSSAARSTWPRSSGGTTSTVATVSSHEVWLE